MKSYDSALLSSSLEEVDHMKQTIDGLLLISEAERSLQKRASLVAPLVSEIEKELFPLMQEKHISLSFTGDIDLSILAEPLLLRTCIRNLLENAVKYSSSPGGITVEIYKGKIHINNTVDPHLSLDTTRIFDEFIGTPGSGNGL